MTKPALSTWRRAGLARGSPAKRRKTQSGAGRCLLSDPRSDAHGHPQPDRCEIRGEDLRQGDALVIGIGNGRQAGGGQQLCPEALINDGQLQLRIFTGDGLLPALFTTLTQPEESPNIIAGKSAWFEVNAPHGMTFNLDGEPLSGEHFRIEYCPARCSAGCRRIVCFCANPLTPALSQRERESEASGDRHFAVQINILNCIDQLHAVSHRFLKRFTAKYQPHTACAFADNRRAYRVRQVSISTRRTAGVNQPGASHVAVRQLVAHRRSGYRWSACCRHGHRYNRSSPPYSRRYFRPFSLHDVSANGCGRWFA